MKLVTMRLDNPDYTNVKRSAVYPQTELKDKLKCLSVQMKRPMYELIDEAIEDYLKGK